MCLRDRHRDAAPTRSHLVGEGERRAQSGLGAGQPGTPIVDLCQQQEIIELFEWLTCQAIESQCLLSVRARARQVAKPQIGIRREPQRSGTLDLVADDTHAGLGLFGVIHRAPIVADAQMHLGEEPQHLGFPCLHPELPRQSQSGVEGGESGGDFAGRLEGRREHRQRDLLARREARTPVESARAVETRDGRSRISLPDVVVRFVREAVSLDLQIAERPGEPTLLAMGLAGAAEIPEILCRATEIAQGTRNHVAVVGRTSRLDGSFEEALGLDELPVVHRDEPEHVVGVWQTPRRCPSARDLDRLLGVRPRFLVVAQSIGGEADPRKGARLPVLVATRPRAVERRAPEHARAVVLVVHEERIGNGEQGVKPSVTRRCALPPATTCRGEHDLRGEKQYGAASRAVRGVATSVHGHSRGVCRRWTPVVAAMPLPMASTRQK